MSNWIDSLVTTTAPTTAVYIAWAGEVEFVGASESDSAGRRVKLRLVRPPEQSTQINPFAAFTRRRRGHAGTRFDVSVVAIVGLHESMMEMALANWADDPRGSTVTFILGNTEAHPFMHDTRASKDQPGTRYMMTFVEKKDDETLVRQDQADREVHRIRTGRSQTLSNAARLLTKNQRFWDWLRETQDDSLQWDTVTADHWLKSQCGVESKTELDADDTPEAASKIIQFHKLRAAFVDWQTAQGYDFHE
jgi:hypothetical protein